MARASSSAAAVMWPVVRPFAPAMAILALQVFVFPAGSGPWALGVVSGLLTALVALGLAVVYRANRVLNFAQGDLGTVPTTIAVGLIAVSGLPWLVGAVLGLGAAVILGAVIELAVVRRFHRSPRLLLTVATIGVSQLLVVASMLLPRWWGKTIFADQALPEPFEVRFEIGNQVFGGTEVLAAIIAPLLLVGLALFLQGTDIGVAVRASAERADRAALLGVPVKRLQTLVWVVAAVLSYVGVFLHAGIFGYGAGAALSPQAMAFALGALVLGRLDHLPAIAASAVALRVLEQGVRATYPSQPGRVYVVLALVILAALIVRRAAVTRASNDAVSTWSAAEEIRPVPRELASLPLVATLRMALPLAAVVMAALVPVAIGPANELKASTLAAFCLITLSVVVLTGWAGLVSLGQMSFVSVGAAVGAVSTATWGHDLSLALILAGMAGAVVAVIVGLPALRLPGLYLAITTMAFALASSNFLFNRSEQSWIPHERLERPALFGTFDLKDQDSMYWFVLVVVVLGFLAVKGMRRGRTGRVLLAVRDNERAAAAYSVSVVRAKLTGFALSGFLAAVAGCLLVHINQAYSEGPFVVTESIGVFTAAVVGGLGSLTGAVLGALYLNGGTWYLPDRWRLLPSAAGVLVVLMVAPGGLGHLLFRLRDSGLRRLARRQGIVVSSLVADTAGADTVPALKVELPPAPDGAALVGASEVST